MKAVVCSKYGPPEILNIQEVNTPKPNDHEVLIQIKATTVAVADVRIRAFNVPKSFWIPARIALGIFKPKQPILGIEFAGVVTEIGKSVTKYKIGDSVFASALRSFGAHAEYIKMAENACMTTMPNNLSFEESAAVPIGARTALHYLKRANIKAGQKVAIYGASGSVGTYAVQLAKYYGAHVTAICSSKNFQLMRALGADTVIDYNSDDFEAQLDSYSIFFLAIDKCDFSICNTHLEPNGVYVNVTMPFRTLEMRRIAKRTQKQFIVGENPFELPDDLIYIKSLIEAGQLKPVIDKHYSFEQIIAAHRYVDQGHKVGNVIIQI